MVCRAMVQIVGAIVATAPEAERDVVLNAVQQQLAQVVKAHVAFYKQLDEQEATNAREGKASH